MAIGPECSLPDPTSKHPKLPLEARWSSNSIQDPEWSTVFLLCSGLHKQVGERNLVARRRNYIVDSTLDVITLHFAMRTPRSQRTGRPLLHYRLSTSKVTRFLAKCDDCINCRYGLNRLWLRMTMKFGLWMGRTQWTHHLGVALTAELFNVTVKCEQASGEAQWFKTFRFLKQAYCFICFRFRDI